MNDNNQKENLLTKFLKAIHEYYIFSFVFLFGLSIIIFGFLYFYHSKNIENRFDNTLQNYEKSMSDIFNNIITNGINKNIYTNSFQTNNNQLQNDSIDKLKLSFEVGFKMLESSMNEIMKNSNDILQFWFAFLSVIMIVFTLIGFFLNNNILDSAKKQLEMVEKEATNSINKIKTMAKAENLALIGNIQIKAKKETKKLIEENNKNIEENNLFNLGLQSANNKNFELVIHYFTEVIKLNPKNAWAYNNIGSAKLCIFQKNKDNKSESYKLLNDAKENFDKAIKLNDKNAILYYNRGETKYNLANLEEKNIEKCSELINEAINDFIISYELDNYNEIKERAKNYLIYFSKNGNEVAIKFCEEHNINYKDNDNKDKN